MGTGDLVEATKEVSEKTRTWTYIFFSKPAALPATVHCFFPTSLVGPGYPFEPMIGTSGIWFPGGGNLTLTVGTPGTQPQWQRILLFVHTNGALQNLPQSLAKPFVGVSVFRAPKSYADHVWPPCLLPSGPWQPPPKAVPLSSVSNENFTTKPFRPPCTYCLHLRAIRAVLFWCPKG